MDSDGFWECFMKMLENLRLVCWFKSFEVVWWGDVDFGNKVVDKRDENCWEGELWSNEDDENGGSNKWFYEM